MEYGRERTPAGVSAATMEQARDFRPEGLVRPRRPAALEETDDGAWDTWDNRHVQAPSRTVQSDITAVGLPEGPGLAFKRFYGMLWQVLRTS